MSIEHDYLTPGELARAMHVSPKTILRWANEGRIPYLVTLGGHRRFLRSDVEALLVQMYGVPPTKEDHPKFPEPED